MYKFKVSIGVYSLAVVMLYILINPHSSVAFMWSVIGITFLYLGFLFAMSMTIRCNFFVKAINRNSESKIVLTFDDGPHPENTMEVLDILDKYGVKAVFFMIGKRVDAHPDLAREVVMRGHQVGIHTQHHPPGIGIYSVRKLRSELKDCSVAIEKATGVKPILFRPPFGVTTPSLYRAIRNDDYITVGWNARSFDTVAKSVEIIIKRVVKLADKGSIILLHDRVPLTCQALPEILEQLKGMGFAFGSLQIKE